MRAFRHCALAMLVLLVGCDDAPPVLEGTPQGPYRLTLAFAPVKPVPGEPTQLAFELTSATNQSAVQDLRIIHERALHTFIIARDFRSFAHLHHEDFAPLGAQDLARATFSFPYTFPRAARYRIVNEFTHRDRTWIKQFDFTVGVPSLASTVKIDLAREKVVGDYRAALAVSPAKPLAGYEAELVLELTRSGQPVTNLALLLGAEVHVALWRIDGEHFAHTHSFTPQMAAMVQQMAGHAGEHSAAMMLKMMSAPATLVYPGPRIPVRYTFPAPGVYQLFLQCAPGSAVQVFPFMLEVAAFREGLDTTFETIVPDA